MWQSLHDAWWRLATRNHPQSFPEALACFLLQSGSVAYRAAVALRNAAYDRGWTRQAALPCRVVSVGNVTVGGTGKTACVELVARKLAAQGTRVAVLSRGYGGARGEYWLRWEQGRLAVHGRAAEAGGLADEPQLLAQHLEGIPVLVGPRRDRTGRRACEELAAQAVILDDGFQHRRLRRDCEIVLVHARMPLSGWALLPRGPMREPLESLSRADIIVLTKADEALDVVGALGERLRAFNPEALIVTASHEPVSVIAPLIDEQQPPRLAGRRVALVSSIGDPAGFEATVRRLQATVVSHRIFPDHHVYHRPEWEAVCEATRATRPEAVLTTEKDWVRLRGVVGHEAPVPVWVLRIEMKLLTGEALFDARLAGVRAR